MRDTLDRYIKELDAIDEKMAALRKESIDIKRKIINEFCPVAVGDILKIEKGYVHIGKSIVVTQIIYKGSDYFSGPFTVKGFILKRDGTMGKVQAEEYLGFKRE